ARDDLGHRPDLGEPGVRAGTADDVDGAAQHGLRLREGAAAHLLEDLVGAGRAEAQRRARGDYTLYEVSAGGTPQFKFARHGVSSLSRIGKRSRPGLLPSAPWS